MKNNIIYFRPEQDPQATTDSGAWIRFETEGGFALIDPLLVLWLGAWTLYAGFQCVQAFGLFPI